MENEKVPRMSSTDALYHTASTIWMVSGTRRFPLPGQLVAAMSPDIREALSRLTSDEAAAMQPGLLGPLGDEYAWRSQEADRDRQRLFDQDMERRRTALRAHQMWARRMKRELPLS